MTIHDILERLRRVRKLGNGWTACCPAHEDRNPSLSVGIGEDGRFLICCQAGCRTADVMEAIGLRLADLFPDDRSRRRAAGPRGSNVASPVFRQVHQPSAARGGGDSPSPAPEPPINWVELCAEIQESLFGTELGALHLQLGVSESALARLECGWSDRHGAYTFPMRNGLGEIVGVSLRGRNGTKWAIPGSRLGFFIPSNLTGEGPLFLPEGASDTAAFLDLGFDAVGRPQALIRNRDRLQWLIDLLRTPLHRNRPAVVVADNDRGAGWAGAKQLALDLRRTCRSIKILPPPPWHKDLRAWMHQGVTANVIIGSLLNRPAVV